MPCRRANAEFNIDGALDSYEALAEFNTGPLDRAAQQEQPCSLDGALQSIFRRKHVKDKGTLKIARRTILKAGAALGATAVFSPPILTYAQGETPIKIGMHDPFTGTYAAEGESEKRGALMALAEVSARLVTLYWRGHRIQAGPRTVPAYA